MRLFKILLFLFFTTSLFSQSDLVMIKQGEKYGFQNKEGKTIIPFNYDDGFDFKGEQTLMKKGKDWGIIDKTGKEITAFKFQHRLGKDMRYCPVYISLEVNGKCGLVEMATGKEITEFKYDWVEVFKNGNTGKYNASISLKGKSGYIDIEGNEYLYTSNYTSGWLIHKGKWGYAISEERYLTPFKYDTATEFKDDYARVCINKKWGLIDTSGKEVLPCMYDIVEKWQEKFTLVSLNGKWAIINAQWVAITPFKYEGIGNYSDGFANVTIIRKNTSGKDEYWQSIVDSTGKEILPFEYEVLDYFYGGLALSEKDKKLGFITSKGEVKIFDFEKYYSLEPGIYLIYKGGKWGVVANGKMTTQIKYEPEIENYEGEVEVFKLSEGFIAFRINNKYGFVNVATGKEITPFKYESVRAFYDGKAEVTLKGKTGYIDKTGKEFFGK